MAFNPDTFTAEATSTFDPEEFTKEPARFDPEAFTGESFKPEDMAPAAPQGPTEFAPGDMPQPSAQPLPSAPPQPLASVTPPSPVQAANRRVPNGLLPLSGVYRPEGEINPDNAPQEEKEIHPQILENQKRREANYPGMGVPSQGTETQHRLDAFVPGLNWYKGDIAEQAQKTADTFQELTGSTALSKSVSADSQVFNQLIDLAAPVWATLKEAGRSNIAQILALTGNTDQAKELLTHPEAFEQKLVEGEAQINQEIATNPKLGAADTMFASLGLDLTHLLITDPINTTMMLEGIAHGAIKGAAELRDTYQKLTDLKKEAVNEKPPALPQVTNTPIPTYDSPKNEASTTDDLKSGQVPSNGTTDHPAYTREADPTTGQRTIRPGSITVTQDGVIEIQKEPNTNNGTDATRGRSVQNLNADLEDYQAKLEESSGRKGAGEFSSPEAYQQHLDELSQRPDVQAFRKSYAEWADAVRKIFVENQGRETVRLKPIVHFFDATKAKGDLPTDVASFVSYPVNSPVDLHDPANKPFDIKLRDDNSLHTVDTDSIHTSGWSNVEGWLQGVIRKDPITGKRTMLIFEVQPVKAPLTDLHVKLTQKLLLDQAVQLAHRQGVEEIHLVNANTQIHSQGIEIYNKGNAKARSTQLARYKGIYDGNGRASLEELTKTRAQADTAGKVSFDAWRKFRGGAWADNVPPDSKAPDLGVWKFDLNKVKDKPTEIGLGQRLSEAGVQGAALGEVMQGKTSAADALRAVGKNPLEIANTLKDAKPQKNARLYTGIDPELIKDELIKAAKLAKATVIQIADAYHKWSGKAPPTNAVQRTEMYDAFTNSLLFDKEKGSATDLGRPILRNLLDPTNNRLVIPAFKDMSTGKIHVGDTAHFPLAAELEDANIPLDHMQPGFVFPVNGKFQLKIDPEHRLDTNRPSPFNDLGQVNMGIPMPSLGALKRTFKAIQGKLSELREAYGSPLYGVRDTITGLADGGRTLAFNYAREVRRWQETQLHGNVKDLEALPFIIESGGNLSNLIKFERLIEKSKEITPEQKKAALDKLAHAEDHWQRLKPHADAAEEAMDNQGIRESENGLRTEYLPNYVPHAIDNPVWTDRGFLMPGKSGGPNFNFLEHRQFATLADAIAQGYIPKTTNIALLMETRFRAGEMLVQEQLFKDSLKDVKLPSGEPVAKDLEVSKETNLNTGYNQHHYKAPEGYTKMKFGDQSIAIHNDYANTLKLLQSDNLVALDAKLSKLSDVSAGVKHLKLLGDIYHLAKMAEKGVSALGKYSYSRGILLLEHSEATVKQLMSRGEATQDDVNYVKANKADIQELQRVGYNIGRVSDALRKDVVKNVPWAGKYLSQGNTFIFEKFQRGLMAEWGIYNLKENLKKFPELTREQVVRKTAKEGNQYFGNLASQGLFKDITSQRLMDIPLLAAQWVQGMIVSEAKSWGQLAKVPIDLVRYRKLRMGALAIGTMRGALAVGLAAQVVNLMSRGVPTWQNPEQGRKLDMYVGGPERGMFISPFAIHAEISHDIYRLYQNNGDLKRTLGQIGMNKISPLMRALYMMWNKSDAIGKPFDTQTRANIAAAIQAAPIPLPLNPIADKIMGHKQPMAIPRQLFAMGGIKAEPMLGATPEVQKLARAYMRENFPKQVTGNYGTPVYSDLRTALFEKDISTAKTYIKKLLNEGNKSEERIREVFVSAASKPFTNSKAEAKFKQSLTLPQRQMYENARKEQRSAELLLNEAFRQIKKEAKN